MTSFRKLKGFWVKVITRIKTTWALEHKNLESVYEILNQTQYRTI